MGIQSFREMGELDLTMDCLSADSPWADEACYFDGKYSRMRGCTAFNTLNATPSIAQSHDIASVQVSSK